ncbi:uncharacterized protein DI49_3765 [Saccharomyces eubayanus]|uniref:uncharacterized protein n=1 Tax=Saccharomyces eubayanus TaxID=1080349 RepID=UPI0006C21CA5|nr:hypothetical protein DI49_3765 [Saccharomyces eubayanus]KOG97945.1 hypothetical protein DI49_3765 [Saccharomyces eubayanus]
MLSNLKNNCRNLFFGKNNSVCILAVSSAGGFNVCFASRRIIGKTENRKKLCLKSISDIYERDRVAGPVAGAAARCAKRSHEGGFRPAGVWAGVERVARRLARSGYPPRSTKTLQARLGAVAQPYRSYCPRWAVVEIRGSRFAVRGSLLVFARCDSCLSFYAVWPFDIAPPQSLFFCSGVSVAYQEPRQVVFAASASVAAAMPSPCVIEYI